MIYTPNFDEECYLCGASPTVVIQGHIVPETQLCGPHFFGQPNQPNRLMVDWEEWNSPPEATE